MVIVTDGMRWQEVFAGADSALLNREYGKVEDTAQIRREFWRPTAEERRQALFPFLWGEVARAGQIYGNLRLGDTATVTNGLKFSYPGYNEMLTGHPDPRINSNSAGPNPNRTVFEWLASQPGFHDSVAALATWDEFGDIFNRERAGFPVRAAWEPPFPENPSPAEAMLNRVYTTTMRYWGDVAYDGFLAAAVDDYVATRKPRLLFVGYGETDEWAHMGRYDRYLEAAHAVDGFIADLWRRMQAMPEYRGNTTFLILTDHGRGATPADWDDHGQDVTGAEYIWFAALGPDTPALGERGAGTGTITQSQLAATVAALLGKNWPAADTAAAPPIAGVIGRH